MYEVTHPVDIASGRNYRPQLQQLLKHPAAGIVIAWLALMLVMRVVAPEFGRMSNLMGIVTNTSVIAIVAMGLVFVMISGGIDLSVGSLLGLTGVIIYLLAVPLGLPSWLAAALGIVFSTAVGALLTGGLVAKGKLSAFVVTLAGMVGFAGLAGVLTNGRTNTIPNPGVIAWLGSGSIGPVPVAPLVMLACFALTTWVLRATWFGREIYAVGGNPEAARLSGVNVARVQVLSFAVAALFVGIAAIIQIGRFRGSVPPTAGAGMELTAVAALLLGGVSLSGGSGGAGGALVGVLFLATAQNSLDILGVSTYWKDVVTGAILVSALLLTTLRGRLYLNGRKKTEGTVL
ncbi:MAG: ABC transporter permease [Bifidobacteriaceae bacterium]|jgi:ribose/xylose/arabinose/galactoside ABC-type transport system permease subunit|nr:ABC transporter permease [Bifidobacteriaceae bacterium]